MEPEFGGRGVHLMRVGEYDLWDANGKRGKENGSTCLTCVKGMIST
jgi:hypothetical protein